MLPVFIKDHIQTFGCMGYIRFRHYSSQSLSADGDRLNKSRNICWSTCSAEKFDFYKMENENLGS